MKTIDYKVGQEVTFPNAYGVNIIIEIKGKTATTFEKNTGWTYKKRLSSLKIHKQREAYWNEQELVHPTYKHGDTIFSTITKDGNGTRIVWDDVKQKCVEHDKLTQSD